MYSPDTRAWVGLDKTIQAFVASWPHFGSILSEDRMKCEIIVSCLNNTSIPFIRFSYHKKNYLLSRDYDLNLSFEKQIPILKNAEIKLMFRKKFRKFYIKRGNDAYAHALVAMLNSEKVSGILGQVEFTDLRIILEPKERMVKVIAGTLFGSSTWLLLPPGFQHIMPKSQECFALLECLDLVGYIAEVCSLR